MKALEKWTKVFVSAVFMVGIAAGGVLAGQTGVSQRGAVTSYTQQGEDAIDFQHVKPMPLPMALTAPPRLLEGGTTVQKSVTPKFVPGSPGSGVLPPGIWTTPVTTENAGSTSEIITPQESDSDRSILQEYGTSNHPFTTSRVDLDGNNPSNRYPYRAAGKLYFKIGNESYVCSASLIKKGLIVTAAHCVADWGNSTFYTGWEYIPAMSGIKKPYGSWRVNSAWVLNSYYSGTDSCFVDGVVCPDDVAVLVVTPKWGIYPGKVTGWLGYGYDGYGFSSGYAMINQLGYPVSHDNGTMMQRTDSQGFVSGTFSDNTVWGSRQTGGSSGGPALVNLGKAAVLSGTTTGTDGDYNMVVGVTSWGYTSSTVKEQGASPFTSTNIKVLVDAACTTYPKACAP
jgi:V8-like Glu-specific endopeptidase